MAFTPEETAFLIKIGQIPDPNDPENPPKETPTKKTEENN